MKYSVAGILLLVAATMSPAQTVEEMPLRPPLTLRSLEAGIVTSRASLNETLSPLFQFSPEQNDLSL